MVSATGAQDVGQRSRLSGTRRGGGRRRRRWETKRFQQLLLIFLERRLLILMMMKLLLRGIARPLHHQNPQPASFHHRIRCLLRSLSCRPRRACPGCYCWESTPSAFGVLQGTEREIFAKRRRHNWPGWAAVGRQMTKKMRTCRPSWLNRWSHQTCPVR